MQKERTIAAHRIITGTDYNQSGAINGQGYWDVPARTEIISYADGPRFSLGHNVWKPCDHVVSKGTSGFVCDVDLRKTHYMYPWMYFGHTHYHYMVPDMSVSIPSGSWDSGLVKQVFDQLDLNVEDSVLLYSGVLQAVPLLGSVFTLNKILRRVAKELKKSFMHKPFTTVLRTAISLDFIDRFVISPTLDDARKFSDAVNYCLRVIQTAHERNSSRFCLTAQSFKGTRDSYDTTNREMQGFLDMNVRTTKGTTSKVFVQLDADYQTQAIDPLKLWAARVGLTKPLDSVWDLVPFSFVIDYFTRAGDFISGLSNEMSSQEGLKGKITNIYGAWGTLKTEHTITYTGTGYRSGDPESLPIQHGPVFGSQVVSAYRFSRFPIDFGTVLNSLPKGNGLISVNLSSTRARTLLELFLQARTR